MNDITSFNDLRQHVHGASSANGESAPASQGKGFFDYDRQNDMSLSPEQREQPQPTLKSIKENFMYGFGKGGGNIYRMIHPDAPEMPDTRTGNRDELIAGIGQYAPLIAGAGSGLGVNAALVGAHAASQASPDEENGMGYLPNGRVTAGLENAAMTFGGGKLLEAIPGLAQSIKKGWDYMQPGKEAEAFRGGFGQGTTKENIENLGQRVQFAKGSAKEEAMIPKRELYGQEGKSNIYNVDTKNLPEGNLDKMAHIMEPGGEFGEAQSSALSSALKNYRKTGNVESFLDKSTDIFNIPELSDKASSKIEDALLMPTKRDSAYFGDEGVTDLYGKRGKIKQLHDAYEDKPILANYDKLQSALGKQIRKLESRVKAKTIDDAGEAKLEAFTSNKENLVQDKENFMKTLPEKMQNLETDFRTKYATGVGKYEDAPLAIRKLAAGKFNEVTGDQIAKVFTNPTDQTKKILLDLGPSAGKNIIYNALQKVPMKDAEGMANTILDLKRTKGYDQFITPDMEQWANNMLKHVRNASYLKKGLIGGASLIGGGAVAGHFLGGK